MVRKTITGLVMALSLGLMSPSSAFAHYKDAEGRWVFGGFTRTDRDGRVGNPSDPVNFFVYPDAIGPTGDYHARLDEHMLSHYRPRWTVDDDMSELFGYCKDPQRLYFTPIGSHVLTDEQGAGYQPTPGLYDDCRERNHTRLWRDVHAHTPTSFNTPHSTPVSWFVGNFHKDEYDTDVQRTHFFRVGWEQTEADIVLKMRRTRESGHVDHYGRRGGHCTHLDWKHVPGSSGYFSDNPRPSDGEITQVAMKHCG